LNEIYKHGGTPDWVWTKKPPSDEDILEKIITINPTSVPALDFFPSEFGKPGATHEWLKDELAPETDQDNCPLADPNCYLPLHHHHKDSLGSWTLVVDDSVVGRRRCESENEAALRIVHERERATTLAHEEFRRRKNIFQCPIADCVNNWRDGKARHTREMGCRNSRE